MAMLINARKMRLAAEDIMAGHTPESFKKMMKDNPELEEEWNKQIEENRGVVSSLEDKWASVSDMFSKPHESVFGKVSEDDTEIMAKFEKGVSADPTENMSPEDKKKWEAMKDKHGDKFKQASFNRSAKENPMNKTARVALRTLTANWGLTANEAYEMLAEDELGSYLAEMEAEMWAEELEAGRSKNPANGSFEVYETQKRPSKPYTQEDWWEDNKTNKSKGGNGAGGTQNFNKNWHQYGEYAGKSEAKYQKSYYEKRFKNNEKPIKRKTCPKFHGRKGPCDAPLSKAK
jgi:hypothetical protein